jgi:hypothetical protein
VSVSSEESVSVSAEESESSEDISSVFVAGEVMALPLPWWLGETSPLTCLSPVSVAGEALPLSWWLEEASLLTCLSAEGWHEWPKTWHHSHLFGFH